MFSPPYLHYPESSSNHFSLKRPGIADAKNLFFFEGEGQEQFADENSARAAVHYMMRDYQSGKAIHWLLYDKQQGQLRGGICLSGDFGSGKCTLSIPFWQPMADETRSIECVQLIKKMCFQHVQVSMLLVPVQLPSDWQLAFSKIGDFEKISTKADHLLWVK
jgi:hypothetical protein